MGINRGALKTPRLKKYIGGKRKKKYNGQKNEKINIISVDYIDGEPLLRIFAKIKTNLPPQREYKFKINSEGSVYLV